MSTSADRPDLRQLRIQAKDLVRAVRAADTDAIARVIPYVRTSSDFTLANAQLVIARENGFESWPRLKRELEGTAEAAKSPTSIFFEALESGDEDLVVELLSENPEFAGFSKKGEYGWSTPLHLAAAKGSLVSAKALVEAGAEIYAVNQGGYPPVAEAIWGKHKAVTDYLLEASAQRDHGVPPTYRCGIDIVLAGRLNMIDRIKMHIDKDLLAVYRRGCIGESVLHWPSHNGYVEIVRYFLEKGAVIEADEIGLYGGKPLHWASEHAPECSKLLLERGANPMSRNLMPGEFEGYTPLHMMARQPNQELECARLLLAAGADPSAKDARGQTPLDVAVLNGREMTREFLARFS